MKTFAIGASPQFSIARSSARCLVNIGSVLLAIVLAGAASRAAATTITFESLAFPGSGPPNIVSGPYIESGYQFVNNITPFDFGNWGTEDLRYPGSTALFNLRQGGITTLTQQGGGEFSIVSLDLMAFYVNSPPQFVTFTGTLPDNSTVTQTFFVPPSGNSITETLFVFNPSFSDVKSVAFGAQDLENYQFDNVTVFAVPEVSSAWLLLFGATTMWGLNFLRRRWASRRATV